MGFFSFFFNKKVVNDVVLVFLMLTLNIFHTFSWCFYWQRKDFWKKEFDYLYHTLEVNIHSNTTRHQFHLSNPANIYLLKFNNRKTWQICSNNAIGVILVYLSLTLNKFHIMVLLLTIYLWYFFSIFNPPNRENLIW